MLESRLEKRNVLCVCVCVPDGDSAQDVSDFNWDDYLEETGAVSVPHHAFKHVGADDLHSYHTSLDKLIAAIHNQLLNVCVKTLLSFKQLLVSNYVIQSKNMTQISKALDNV